MDRKTEEEARESLKSESIESRADRFNPRYLDAAMIRCRSIVNSPFGRSTTTAMKHVYILGAGFSYPLGGPLFADLLTVNMDSRVQWLMRPKAFQPRFEGQLNTFTQIGAVVHGWSHLTKLIRFDAEQFLELCESCEGGNGRAFDVLREIGGMENYAEVKRKNSLDDGACFQACFQILKQRIAVETNGFLWELPQLSDRWKPYEKWYRSLSTDDTIITTNYDLTVETLRAQVKKTRLESRTNLTDYDFVQNAKTKQPKLLKLHGSVDWTIENDGIFVEPFVLGKPADIPGFIDRNIAVGTPGLSKQKLAESSLKHVWDVAQSEIENAEILSVVGYSMPETDNTLRMMILDAIAASKRLVAINIILGPVDPKGERAKSIIVQASPSPVRHNVKLLPIYSQDYLPRFRPQSRSDVDSMAFDV